MRYGQRDGRISRTVRVHAAVPLSGMNPGGQRSPGSLCKRKMHKLRAAIMQHGTSSKRLTFDALAVFDHNGRGCAFRGSGRELERANGAVAEHPLVQELRLERFYLCTKNDREEVRRHLLQGFWAWQIVDGQLFCGAFLGGKEIHHDCWDYECREVLAEESGPLRHAAC